MDLKRLSSKAKELIDKRGGTDSLKEDADELKRIAQGEGSLADKAKEAAAALKEPGADEEPAADAPAAEAPAPAEAARAEQKTERESRGKHAGGQGQRRGQGKRRGGGPRGGGRGANRALSWALGPRSSAG
jgi:hypothetical protein